MFSACDAWHTFNLCIVFRSSSTHKTYSKCTMGRPRFFFRKKNVFTRVIQKKLAHIGSGGELCRPHQSAGSECQNNIPPFHAVGTIPHGTTLINSTFIRNALDAVQIIIQGKLFFTVAVRECHARNNMTLLGFESLI